MSYWHCLKKDCSVRMISQNLMCLLVEEMLPDHVHATNLLKSKA